jgi:hypothetical protein
MSVFYKGTLYRAMPVDTPSSFLLPCGSNLFFDLENCFLTTLHRRKKGIIIFSTKENPPRAKLHKATGSVMRSIWPIGGWKPLPKEVFKKMVEDIHVRRVEQSFGGVRFIPTYEVKYRRWEESALNRFDELIANYPEGL